MNMNFKVLIVGIAALLLLTAPAAASSIKVANLNLDGETVTVVNQGGSPVDMTSWKITDEGEKHTFVFPAGFVLNPGASVVIMSGPDQVGGAGTISWKKQSVWNNDGDVATLWNANGKPVSSTDGLDAPDDPVASLPTTARPTTLPTAPPVQPPVFIPPVVTQQPVVTQAPVVVLPPTMSDSEMDTAYTNQITPMAEEITSILNEISQVFSGGVNSANFSAQRAVGSKLSTRSRFWYDTLNPMPVSTKLAGSKQSTLLGLKEFESAGDDIVRSMDFTIIGDFASADPLMTEAGTHITNGGNYFGTAADQLVGIAGPTITPAAPIVISTPAPVSQPVVQPVATQRPARTWGKRYTVGDPGTFLGSRSATGTAPTGTSTRVVAATGPTLKPGSRSYGVTPPASGSFVRWYPAARWAAGIK
jgi:hypothetical protein